MGDVKMPELTPHRPTVPEVVPLAQLLYQQKDHGEGGHLHVVLDDNNVEDYHVRWAINHAREQGCALCASLGFLLLSMTQTQRRKVSSLGPYRNDAPLVVSWS